MSGGSFAEKLPRGTGWCVLNVGERTVASSLSTWITSNHVSTTLNCLWTLITYSRFAALAIRLKVTKLQAYLKRNIRESPYHLFTTHGTNCQNCAIIT